MRGIELLPGDCLEVLAGLEAESFDSCVTDPPYHLTSIVKRFGSEGSAPAKSNGTGVYARSSAGFMGKQWDGGGVAFDPTTWKAVYRVLKPGAHLLAFGGTRTYHRMVCAIEDAGFEIRDQVAWLYGSGFPKSHDVSKAIDREAGAKGSYGAPKTPAHAGWIDRGAMRGGAGHEGYQRPWMQDGEAVDRAARQYEPATFEAMAWQGWGTALKPALEPICVARKPLIGTVAENVREHGTGALNIDGCRIASDQQHRDKCASVVGLGSNRNGACYGEWTGERADSYRPEGRWPANVVHDGSPEVLEAFEGTEDSPARFFYSAKADKQDRWGSKHPTVKPIDLIRWLQRLVTPPGGHVLDPFAGSGTSGVAAFAEGFRATLIEREAEYCADIEARVAYYAGEGKTALETRNRAKTTQNAGPLFA